jgi:hypothetical protein
MRLRLGDRLERVEETSALSLCAPIRLIGPQVLDSL